MLGIEEEKLLGQSSEVISPERPPPVQSPEELPDAKAPEQLSRIQLPVHEEQEGKMEMKGTQVKDQYGPYRFCDKNNLPYPRL